MKIQMELFKSSGVWLVKTDDPKVMELFGTDTLPAPFSDSTPWETVLSTIRKLNPNNVVTLADYPKEVRP